MNVVLGSHNLFILLLSFYCDHHDLFKLKAKARRAVNFLSLWLEINHPRVIGQTPSEVCILA